MSTTVEFRLVLPRSISDESKDAVERNAREGAVLQLWQGGEISTREAAAELGLEYREFLDLLSRRGIPSEPEFDSEAFERAARLLNLPFTGQVRTES